jgi:signal transduction histidine kinase
MTAQTEGLIDLERGKVRKRTLGLSSRLLILTVIFVMIAEVLIFVPSMANFRNSWLQDRVVAARTAALVIEAAPADALPETLVRELLMSVGAESIALRIRGIRRLLAAEEAPPMAELSYDLREITGLNSISQSFNTLFFGGSRFMRITGEPVMGGEFIEIVVREAPLRAAMLRFSWNIILLSLAISGITALLVFLSLRSIIVRPVERLTRNITRFAERPDDATRLMQPSGRTDEIGRAEVALQGMQRTLAQQLKQKEHLAALGLAVSKINHDLRNILASAQLISDRLSEVPDPTVQRFAPKLIQTLDRAIQFCQTTLNFGRADERQPVFRRVPLAKLFEDVREGAGLIDGHAIQFENAIDHRHMVDADPEHLFRAGLNLCRNAVQAMESVASPDGKPHTLTVRAREDRDWHWIDIEDTGPGVPDQVKPRLFEAFGGTTRPGGSGLGLAIAADLVRSHGGAISLVERDQGACFRIALPKTGALG